jgi:hypothetical protein
MRIQRTLRRQIVPRSMRISLHVPRALPRAQTIKIWMRVFAAFLIPRRCLAFRPGCWRSGKRKIAGSALHII